MPHNDGTSEEGNDAWESSHFSYQVGQIAIEENQTGFFDGELDERLVYLEQVTEPEPRNQAQSQAEKEQVQKGEEHVQHGPEPE